MNSNKINTFKNFLNNIVIFPKNTNKQLYNDFYAKSPCKKIPNRTPNKTPKKALKRTPKFKRCNNEIKIRKHHPNARMPTIKNDNTFGVHSIESKMIYPDEIIQFNTGISLTIPDNHSAKLMSPKNKNLKLMSNNVQLRGCVKVILKNNSTQAILIKAEQKLTDIIIM
jgi:dUTPase